MLVFRAHAQAVRLESLAYPKDFTAPPLFKSSRTHLKGISENFTKNFSSLQDGLLSRSSVTDDQKDGQEGEGDSDDDDDDDEEVKPSSTPRTRFGKPFWQHMYGGPLPNLDPATPALNLGEDQSLVEVGVKR